MTTPNTPETTKPAPDMAVEASELLRILQTTLAPDKYALDGEDRKFWERIDACRAALARPLEEAEDDLRSLKEADAMLGDIGALLRNQNQFTGSYTEIVKQLLAASRAPVAVGVEPECENCNQLARALREATEPPIFMGEPVGRHARAQQELSAVAFICFLIDNHEGEVVAEESLQQWLGEVLKNPRYSDATPSAGAGGSVGGRQAFHATRPAIPSEKVRLELDMYNSGEKKNPSDLLTALHEVATPAPSVPLGGEPNQASVLIAMLAEGLPMDSLESHLYAAEDQINRLRAAHPLQAQDAAPVEVPICSEEGYLCYAYGEDSRVARLCHTREEVLHFMLREWFGMEKPEDMHPDNRESWDTAVEEFDAPEWDLGEQIVWELEQGGVEITKVCFYPTPAPAQDVSKAAGVQGDAARLDWLEIQSLSDLCFDLVVDAPHDGDYCIQCDGKNYYGKTLRAAIDAARAQSTKGA